MQACAVRDFEEALGRPVTRADAEADRRRDQRLQALLRGDIPSLGREGGRS